MKVYNQVARLGLGRFSKVEAQGEAGKRYAKFPIFPQESKDDTAPTWVTVLGDKNIEAAQNLEKGKDFVVSLDLESTFFEKDDKTKVNKTDVKAFNISALTADSELGVQTKGGWTLNNQGFNFGGKVEVKGEGDKVRATAPLFPWEDKDFPVKNASAVFVTTFGKSNVDNLVALSEAKNENDKGVGVLVSGSVAHVNSGDKVFMNVVAEKIKQFVPKQTAEATAEAEQQPSHEPAAPAM